MLRIHSVSASDRDDWRALWLAYLTFYETTLDDDVTDATFARLTSDDPLVHGVLARDETGTPIGIVHWLTHPSTWATSDYCYLEDLYVAPEARGTGAGAALIEHVRAWAAERGLAKLYWLTANDNTLARRLYDRVATDTGFVHYEIDLER